MCPYESTPGGEGRSQLRGFASTALDRQGHVSVSYAVRSRGGGRAQLVQQRDMEDRPPVVTEKPWGRELLLRSTDTYVVKVLCVRAGCRLSLQYHTLKRETLLLGSGNALLEIHLGGEVIQHSLDEAVDVAPGTAHRLVALEDSEIVEVSTTELDDVVRLEDDYGRKGV